MVPSGKTGKCKHIGCPLKSTSFNYKNIFIIKVDISLFLYRQKPSFSIYKIALHTNGAPIFLVGP